MGLIIFNNGSTKDLNAEVEAPPSYSTPERDYDVVHIPGRNGDLVNDQGSYQNIEARYTLSIVPPEGYSFSETMRKFESWLHSGSGYCKLEDSYDQEHYRLAYYKEANEIENFLNKVGKVTLTFVCKPERYLKSGEEPVVLSNGSVIVNSSGYISKPIFIVYGSGNGTFSINGITVTITNIVNEMVIDCEFMDVYKDGQNLNKRVSISPIDVFPEFVQGNNIIGISGGISSLIAIPRWWSL